MKNRVRIIDVVLVSCFVAFVTAAAMSLNLMEYFISLTAPHIGSELDDFLFVFSISLAVGMSWFSLRRTREANREIDERRMAQGALRESEGMFETVFEAAEDSIFIKDLSLRYTHVNPAMERLFGLGAEELIGKTDDELFGEESGAHIRGVDSRVLGGEIIEEEHTKPVGGRLFTFHVIKVPLRDESGEITGLCGIARNITDRKRAEETLRAISDGTSGAVGEEFFSNLVRHMASALGIRYGVVGELVNSETESVRTLAVWAGEDFADNFEYDLRGTPCEGVASRGICRYPRDIQKLFPEDYLLGEMGIESYMGTPLIDSSGVVLGILAVMDDKPMEESPLAEEMLKIFSTRAVAELERKRAEKALIESEHRFRELFNNMSSGVAVYEARESGEDFVIKDFNRAGEIKTEFVRDEIVGRSVLEVFPGVVDFGLFEVFKRVWKTGEPESRPIALYRDDRLSTWFENYVYKLPSGEIVAVFDDVTARKQAEEALKKAHGNLENRVKERTLELIDANEQLTQEVEERRLAQEALKASERNYREIFNASNEALFVQDINTGAIIDANQAVCDMLDYTLEEIQKLDVGDLSLGEPPYSQEDAQRWIQKAAEEGPQVFEWLVRRKNGEVFWAEVNLKHAVIGGQERLLALARDITGSKRAQEAIRESEHSYRTLAENLPGMVYRVFLREGNRKQFLNDMLHQMTGYGVEELSGGDVCLIDNLILPEDRENILATIEQAVRDDVTFEVEYRIEDKKGDRRHFLERGRPIYGDDGDPLYIDGVILDITERKEAEEALRLEREQILSIFESINEVVYVSDPETHEVLYANKTLVDMFGRDPTGGKCYREFQGQDSPCDWCTNEIILERKYEPYTWEYHNPVVGRDYMISDRIIRWPDGRDVRFEIAVDITERKRAEEALRENERFLKSIFDGIQDGLNVVDAQLNILRVNKWMEEKYALSLPLEGKKCYEAFHKRGSACPWCPVVKTIETGEAHGEVIGYPSNTDPEGWLEHSAFPLKDAEGRVFQVIKHVKDVTHRKLAEEALRESEEKYRGLFENESDAVMVYDAETLRFEDANPASLALYGYTKEEFMSLTVEDISAEKETTRIAVQRLKGEEPGTGHIPLRYHKKKDGARFPVEISSGIFFSEGQKKIIGAVRDITERVAGEEEKSRLQAQLMQAQKMEAIGTLAGGIAHDFNNILSAIAGYTEMCLDDLPASSRSRGDLEEVLRGTKRARDLVAQILIFSRHREQEKRPVRLIPIVREALKLLRATLPATIEMRQSLSAQSDTIMADQVQIHQILMNLCTNAAHALGDKAGIIEIGLSEIFLTAQEEYPYPDILEGPYLKLTVRDTGRGMTDEVMERIFEPFFSTKRVGEGSGLGLSVVYGIVKGHGGAINVSSSVGEGSTFEIFLPGIDYETSQEEVSTEPLPRGTERILFVDDEEPLVSLGRRMLERLGYTVAAMTDSVKALETFRSGPEGFDLVITDQTMPRMTGAELAREVMKIRPGIPVIICTGFSEALTPDYAMSIGIREFIMKPIVKRRMADTVRKVLDG